jgi:putative transposase
MGMMTRHKANRHRRRSIRLPGYDYRQEGAYFVTICTHQKELLFEDPTLRCAAETLWQRLSRHFPHVQLDRWVVMPNHLHAIVVLTYDPCRGEASQAIGVPGEPTPADAIRFAGKGVSGDASPLLPALRRGSLGAIVGNFKSVTARRINRLRRTPGMPVWQRNYYEHIVRNEHALNAIRQYITDNPARWAWDTYNPSAVGPDPQTAELWRLLQEGADGYG